MNARNWTIGWAIAAAIALLAIPSSAWAAPLAAPPPPNPPSLVSLVPGGAAVGVEVGPDGAVFTCGYLSHEVTGYDATLTRQGGSAPGWSVTWNGANNSDDQAVDVALASDGSVYVLVWTDQGTSPTSPPSGAVLLKYSSSGELQWEVDSSLYEYTEPSQLAVDGSGDAYVCGTRSFGEGDLPTFLERYLPDGTKDWSTLYVAPWDKTDTFPTDLLVTAAGTAYVVGMTEHDGTTRGFVRSWRADGSRRWTKLYNGPGSLNAGFSAVTACPAGGIYVVGQGGRGTGEDLLVVRYRVDGTRALTRRLGVGDGRSQFATDVTTDDRGRIAICGGWEAPGKGYYVAVLRTDGTKAWSHNYPGDASDWRPGYAKLIAVDSAGRVVVAGNGPVAQVGTGFSSPLQVYAFRRTGAIHWASTWPDPLTAPPPIVATPSDIAIWQASNLWVCGSYGLSTGTDQLLLGWDLTR